MSDERTRLEAEYLEALGRYHTYTVEMLIAWSLGELSLALSYQQRVNGALWGMIGALREILILVTSDAAIFDAVWREVERRA